MPLASVQLTDEFVDTNGTSLTTHDAGWSNASGTYVCFGNRMRPNATGAVAVYAGAAVTGRATLSAYAEVTLVSTSPTSRSGVLLYNPTSGGGYSLNITQAGALQLQTVSGAGLGTLGGAIASQSGLTFTVGNTYPIELQWDTGGTMRGYFNGSLVINLTTPDTTYTGLTTPGIRENAGSAPTDTTAVHFERVIFSASAAVSKGRQSLGRGIGRGIARGLR